MSTQAQIQYRRLGTEVPGVFPIGLGCMGMSGAYGPVDERECIATIHAAIDAGISLLDTGDFYGMGHNELLVGRAIRDRRDKVLLSVKFGALRGPDGNWLGYDGRAVAVKNSLAHSLTRLGVDRIDIYRPARVDPAVPIEDTVLGILSQIQAGYIGSAGLSEVSAETIRRAQVVCPIADVQLEYSLVSRRPEERVLPTVRTLDIGVTAYGVLSRGLLSGSTPTSPFDLRSHLPRFVGENLTQNRRLVDALRAMAVERGVTPAQLAIAWVLAKDARIVPIIGAHTRAQLAEALGALEIALTPEELTRLEAAVPASAVAGTRYSEMQMEMLDSEQ